MKSFVISVCDEEARSRTTTPSRIVEEGMRDWSMEEYQVMKRVVKVLGMADTFI